jgi:glutathione S-transferase
MLLSILMTNPELSLYFSPLACSFSSRAVVYELGVNARLVEVDHGRLPNGDDFKRIHPLGLVPALVLQDGEVITENAAVLQYLGDRFREHAELTPSDPRERTRLHTWLSFIGTELHKGVFIALLDERAPPDAKAYALSKADERLNHLAAHLAGRNTLLESGLSVADAYLCAVLNWSIATPIDLQKWPAIAKYHARLLERPSFARALGEERQLWADRNPERARLIQQRHEQQPGVREAS